MDLKIPYLVFDFLLFGESFSSSFYLHKSQFLGP